MAGVGDRAYFHAPCFEIMRYSVGRHTFYGSRTDKERLTGVGAWARFWACSGGNDVIRSSAIGPNVESPLAFCAEERSYNVRLARLLSSFYTVHGDQSKLSKRLN